MMGDDMLARALAAARRAAEDQNRGTLMGRTSTGREYRRTAFDTMVSSGGGLPTLVHQIVGVDLDTLT
jgi:hypothetical protein